MYSIIYRISRLFGVDFPEILLQRDDESLILPEVETDDTTLQLPDINFIGIFGGRSVPGTFGRSIFSKTKNSIWIIQNDLIPQGKLDDPLKHEYVPGIASVFGIPLDEWLIAVLDMSFSIVKKFHGFDSAPIFPLYKGVDPDGTQKFIDSNCHTLDSEDGMLGRGVYLGTFWKACRYAGWPSSETLRIDPPRQGGVVFRYYVWAGRIITAPWGLCECSGHSNKISGSAAEGCRMQKLGDYDYAVRRYVDHLSTWRENYDCAVVKPSVLKGFAKDWKTGRKFMKSAFIVRNEEWITKMENIQFVSAAMVDWTTIECPYNPRQRNVRVF